MFSKFQSDFRPKKYFFRCILYILLFTLYVLHFTLLGFPEVIDRIVAIVNDQIITLTDIRIVKTFGLYKEESSEKLESPPSFILESLINQKLVTQLSREKVEIKKDEVEAYLEKIQEKIGQALVQKKLEEFGLNLDDLEGYIRQRILFEKLISRKFYRGIAVSLEEIENFYQKKYVPSQQERGLKLQPMIEIVDEIESKIREEKRKKQVEHWMNNLRREADIQIKIENLNEFFKKTGKKYG